jgi:hypothetical protein
MKLQDFPRDLIMDDLFDEVIRVTQAETCDSNVVLIGLDSRQKKVQV